MIEIRMPRLSEGMTEGKLLLWNVAVGDHVQAGDQVAEVEADKANMEIEAPMPGIICRLVGNPGDMIAVNDVIAEIKDDPSHESDHEPSEASVAQPTPQTEPIHTEESPLERRKKQFAEGSE